MDNEEELEYETLENIIDVDERDLNEGTSNATPEPRATNKEAEAEDASPKAANVDRASFDIRVPSEKHKVTEADIEDLYDSLEVDLLNENIKATALFVRALTPLTVYEIERVFAEFEPARCALLNNHTGVVRFKTAYNAAEALIGSTKKLVRVRHETAPEDGEVASDDEDVRVEDGDKVVILKPNTDRKPSADEIQLDLDDVKVPKGQWRVVAVHVPKDRWIFVRLSTKSELRKSMLNPYNKEVSDAGSASGGRAPIEYEAKEDYRRKRVRPGINVFDEKGRELDWDYEHDTRFYEDAANAEDGEPRPKKAAPSGPEEINISGTTIKSRGRGSKKFVAALLDDDSD